MSQRTTSRISGRPDKRIQGSGGTDGRTSTRSDRGSPAVDGSQNGRPPARVRRRDFEDGRPGRHSQKADTKPSNFKTNQGRRLFSGTSQLSTLVNKALHDDDRERRITALRNLKEYLLRTDHAKEVQRQADNLLLVLYDVLNERTSSDVRLEVVYCLASVGIQTGLDLKKFFHWLFGKVLTATTDEIKSLLLLVIVQILKRDSDKQQCKHLIGFIMTNVQSTLENADSPELLISSMNAIHYIFQLYPEVFSDHFKDTVDILVGWHIDTSQKPALIKYCSDSLISFHDYWLADMHFSITLLGQFLEDMEAYSEDLSSCATGAARAGDGIKADDDEIQTPEVCMTKILALINVFATVVKCLGDGLSPRPGSPITSDYMSEVFQSIIRCAETVKKESSEPGSESPIVSAATECLVVLCEGVGLSLGQCQHDMVRFALKQLDSVLDVEFPCTSDILSPLGLLYKVLKYQSSGFPADMVQMLFGPGSKFKNIRFHNNHDVLAMLLKVYQKLLCIKDVPMLEAIYSSLLFDLEVAYNALLAYTGVDTKCQLVPDNPIHDCQPTLQEAEVMVVFDLSTLSEIGCTKSSIIVMWALSPTLFDLLTKNLSATHWSIAEYFPATHYALLNTLCAHSESNSHFISSSFGLSTNMGSGSSKTSSYFRTILNLLGMVLPHPMVSNDSRRLCLKWFYGILQHLQQGDYKILYVTAPFNLAIQALLPLAHNKELNVCLGACQCLQLVLVCGEPCADFLLGCLEMCKMKLQSSNDMIRRTFTTLLAMLPCDILLRNELSPLSQAKRLSQRKQATVTFSEDDPQGLQAFRLARRSHISKTPMGTFHSQDFRTVMAFILLGDSPSDPDWMEKLYHSCQRPNKATYSHAEITLPDFIDGNLALQWFWATWEAAQYCVLAKLRTPLGKPQETFRAIEAALVDFGRDVKSQAENNFKSSCKVLSPAYHQHQLRPVLLLQFLEHLEKLVYNAYEGFAIAMPSPPKAVRTFFRTNRATCQDWLRNIRRLAVATAVNCGQHAVALRHSLIMIQDLIAKSSTTGHLFEDTALQATTSLIKLHCPHAITGLNNWIQGESGRTLGWMMACLPAADSRHEACTTETLIAIKKYLQVDEMPHHPHLTKASSSADLSQAGVRSKVTEGHTTPTKVLTRNSEMMQSAVTQSPKVVEFLLNQVTESYIALSNWTSALKWQETLSDLRSLVPEALQKHIVLGCDINVIKALSSFDNQDFASVSNHLDLIPGLSPASTQDDGDDDIHMAPESIRSPGAVLLRGQLELVQALTHYHVSGCVNAPLPSLTTDVMCHTELATVCKMLEVTNQIAESGLALAWQDWPSDPPVNCAVLMQRARALMHIVQGYLQHSLVPVSEVFRLEPSQHDVSIAGQVSKVTTYLHDLSKDNPGFAGIASDLLSHLSKVRLAIAHLARKQGNHRYAQSQLLQHLDLLSTSEDTNTATGSVDLEIHGSSKKSVQPLLTALTVIHSRGETSLEIQKAVRESAKLLQAIGCHQEAWECLSGSSIKYATLVKTGGNRDPETTDVSARSLLTLVKWFTADYRNAVQHLKAAVGPGPTEAMSKLAGNISELLDMEHTGTGEGLGLGVEGSLDGVQQEVVGKSPAISDTDAVCGRLLHLSTMQAPSLIKAWSSLASWCYRWGRKAVDVASSEGGVQLTEEEKSSVLSSLPTNISNNEADSILSILSQAHCSATSIQEEDILEQMQSAYHDGTDTTRRQLLNTCPSLQSTDPKVLDSLLEVWNGVCRRIFSHYRLAARSYFTFLKLAGEPSKKLSVSHHIDETTLSSLRDFGETEADSAEAQATHEDGNITATLRLLRLLVKYAGELRDVLENGLAHTPTGPWKSIIPQLFSRLSHPEAYVRQSISDLLCRVAQDSPHLIVYQAIVGCPSTSAEDKKSKDVVQQGVISKLLKSPNKDMTMEDTSQPDGDAPSDQGHNGESTDDDEEHNRSLSILEDCLTAIVGTLSKHSPELVGEVEILVQELRRITVLWEELWLGTLNQLHVDVNRRLHQLEEEVKRVQRNDGLSAAEKKLIIAEKHNAIMKPVVYSLEQVHSITSQAAETPNEKAFQEAYQETIEKALNALKNPETPNKPQTGWAVFKQLHGTLQQRATRKATFMLQMRDISPKLSSMENTTIPLPGLVCHHSQVVRISSFDNSVNILPTKTKPKKLMFHGADGKRYTYLFKGLEDLHLDERIMQFLSIVNTMFARNKRQEASLYHACHYSVTPLGPRSGLIQWVDGATALFGLYKRWQQREAIAAAAAKNNSSAGQPALARPSEVYYKKMKPALEEIGLSEQTARKDWPISIMRSVMQELISDTPSDLLAKELWCSSGSSSEWWHITQAYSRSTAVMSVIGYIIGLGDRHLDNVLVNFVTGDVVHIDYNVCFEKGKNLRVPERVPFRMTQNIQGALGVTGVEGTFRQSAEEVLKIMRKGRETLLTLLEAFVYDPLVDWTTANEGGFASAVYGGGQMNPVVADGGQSKREMEREITRSLFSSRVAEMKGPWFKNRDDMLEVLSSLEVQLSAYLEAVRESKDVESSTSQYTKHIQLVQKALGDKNHVLHSLSTRYSECQQADSTRSSMQQAIQDKLRELDHWHIQHKLALETARGNHLSAISRETEKDLELGPAPYAPCVKFLSTAGQSQIIGQCEHLETELSSLLQQRRTMLRGCVKILQTYCDMASQFPASFAEMNRAYVWQTWLQELVCDLSASKCKDLKAKFQFKYNPPTSAQIQDIVAMESALNGLMTEANSKLVKAVDVASQTDVPQMEQALQETHAQIVGFVKENGDTGVTTLAAVLMNALCSFSQRSLIMEGAVAGAGDLLVDFTSRNGNWFLEELCSMIANLDAIVNLINGCQWPKEFDAAPIQASLDCFKLIRLVYESLQDMYSQFQRKVLPRVIATLQSGDDSVDHVISELKGMCNGPSLLPKVLHQIKQDLTSVTLGMEGDLISTNVVDVMRTQFNTLLQVGTSAATEPPDTTPQPPTQGQILLDLISAPFAKVEAAIAEFVSEMEQLSVPPQWRKVNVIQEAKSMQCTVLNSNTQHLLRDWVFIQQLETTQEFIMLCQKFAKATSGSDMDKCERQSALLSEAQFIKPVKKFMANLIRKQTIGILSQTIGLCTCSMAHQLGLDTLAEINAKDIGANSKASLEDMCKKAVEAAIKKGLVQSHLYAALNNYTKTYDAGWRALAQARQKITAVTASRESTQNAQLQIVRYQWLYEDVLQEATASQKQNTPFLPPTRSSVMSDLRKRTQRLLALESAITAVQEQAIAQQISVSQRLKWAAGANPTLQKVLKEFEKAVGDRATSYAMENKRSAEVSALSNAILHFEALRTRTSEAINAETSFLALLTRCLDSCKKVEQCGVSITPLEQDLLDLKPPTAEAPIGRKWICSARDVLLQNTAERETAVVKQEGIVHSKRDALHGQIDSVKNTLATHHKLMSEVKTHLKTLARSEEDEADEGTNTGSSGDGIIKTFMLDYKSYSEEFTSTLKRLLVDSSEDDKDNILKLSEIMPMMASLAEQTKRLFDQMVGLAAPLVPKLPQAISLQATGDAGVGDETRDNQAMKGSKTNSPIRATGQLSKWSEGTPATPPTAARIAISAQQPKGSPAVMRDPRTGKVIQVRNTHAINVWRRVKGKLDGRDPEPSKRLSIAEQVDFVIKEATGLDNLATLYEGWTAWV